MDGGLAPIVTMTLRVGVRNWRVWRGFIVGVGDSWPDGGWRCDGEGCRLSHRRQTRMEGRCWKLMETEEDVSVMTRQSGWSWGGTQ
jgi:hypothetical protein